jgi:hypothetical protein
MKAADCDTICYPYDFPVTRYSSIVPCGVDFASQGAVIPRQSTPIRFRNVMVNRHDLMRCIKGACLHEKA